MLSHFLTSVISSIVFVGFFIGFSLSLDFWGRLFLKAINANKASEVDGMFTSLAASAAVILICRQLSSATHSFEIPLIIFTCLGLIGAVRVILKKVRLASLTYGKRVKNSEKEITKTLILKTSEGGMVPRCRFGIWKDLISGYEWFFFSGLLCLVLGFYFSWIWPSGSMDLWYTPSSDFYSWIFFAGYWMGYGSPEIYGIQPYLFWHVDL